MKNGQKNQGYVAQAEDDDEKFDVLLNKNPYFPDKIPGDFEIAKLHKVFILALSFMASFL